MIDGLSIKSSTMKKTIIILLLAVIAIPVLALSLDRSISEHQLTIIQNVVILYLGVSLASFILSELTKNYSQVDKLWSIIPMVYAWMMAYMADWQPRVLLMAALVTVWGVRLTYNFSRRGGYSFRFWEGEEDYRWEVLRQNPIFKNKVVWTLFNFFFVSFYQHGLLMLITLPMIAVSGSETPLGMLDAIVALLFVGFVVFETVADQQQWNYQQEKHRLKNENLPMADRYRRGFIAEGLWSISRHPNYFAEQSIWVVFYLFSVVATGAWFNWTICGAVLLIMLFQGSANFSEDITAQKYPLYQKYQQLVPKFLPAISFKVPSFLKLTKIGLDN